MKKIMTKLFIAMVAMVACVGFVSCEDKEQNGNEINLAGKWYTYTDDFQEILIIEEDHSMVSIGSDGEDIWMGIKGQLTIDGDRFEMIFEDDDNTEGTFTLEGNKFTIMDADGSTLVYTKLEEDLSVVGEWAYASSICYIRAIADEISLPVGSVVEGEVIPTTIPTSQIRGEFVENAVQKYFKNINFNADNTLTYSVNMYDEERQVSKNYTVADNTMTISGESGGINHTTSFMVFQSPDHQKTFLLLTKEAVAEMFVGYAHALRQDGTSSGSEEALSAFKEEFLAAFQNYAITITLTAK